MNVSSVNTRARVRVTLAIIFLLVSGAPSLVVAGPETLLAAAASEEIVIDNSQAELVGAWTRSTYKANYYRTDYLYRPAGSGANRILWRPTLVHGGTYAVYYWLPSGAADRASNATFTVRHATGTTQVRADQRISPGGTWKALGSFVFPAGTASTVELTDGASGTYVVGDAVKFVFVPDVPTPAEIIVDNDTATVGGTWTGSTTRLNYYGTNYLFRPSGGTGSQHGPMDTASHRARALFRVLPASRRPGQQGAGCGVRSGRRWWHTDGAGRPAPGSARRLGLARVADVRRRHGCLRGAVRHGDRHLPDCRRNQVRSH